MMRLTLSTLALAAAALSAPAHALETKPSRIPRVAGDMVVKYASDRGIPANDPRTFATLKGLSTSLAKNATYAAGGALAAAGAAGTAPAWGSVLLTIAIGVGLDYAIDIAADGSYKMVFENGAVTTIAPPLPGAEFNYYPAGFNKDNYQGECTMSIVADLCEKAGDQASPISQYPLTCMRQGQPNPTYSCLDANSGVTTYQDAYRKLGLESEVSEGTKKKYQTIGEAFTNMPEQVKSKPLSADAIATILDKSMKQAQEMTGYEGLPYSPTRPITPQEVKELETFKTDPPLVGDFIAPQPDPGTSFSPQVPAPGAAPGGSTGTSAPPVAVTPDTPNPDAIKPPEGAAKVDLGPDPAIGTPNLEATPTVPMILDPIMNMLPSFKSFAVPSHSTVCPRPTFDFFGNTMTMTAHCEIAEKNRSTIFGFMLAVFAIAGVTIILKA